MGLGLLGDAGIFACLLSLLRIENCCLDGNYCLNNICRLNNLEMIKNSFMFAYINLCVREMHDLSTNLFMLYLYRHWFTSSLGSNSGMHGLLLAYLVYNG